MSVFPLIPIQTAVAPIDPAPDDRQITAGNLRSSADYHTAWHRVSARDGAPSAVLHVRLL